VSDIGVSLRGRTDKRVRVYRLTGVPDDPDQDPVRAAWLQLERVGCGKNGSAT